MVYILTLCVYRIPRPLSVDPSSVGTPFPCVQLSEETGFPGKEKVHVSTDESVLLSLCSAALFYLIMRGKQPAQIRALFLAPPPPHSSTRNVLMAERVAELASMQSLTTTIIPFSV